VADPLNPRGIRRIDQTRPPTGADPNNALWIDRARIFQVAMSKITDSYGTVDSSINDLPTEPNAYDPGSAPKNYCERQGRCIIGCLPGARHTLNKQLMAAIFGTPQNPTPQLPNLKLQALAEVDYVAASPDGGYAVHYIQRDAGTPSTTTAKVVTADRVIIAAGCVGTNEILLRSKARGGLPSLSEKLGFGFSTNGDYLAFLTNTRERVSLTRVRSPPPSATSTRLPTGLAEVIPPCSTRSKTTASLARSRPSPASACRCSARSRGASSTTANSSSDSPWPGGQ
jgi:cholesterol oxidase